ncbi:hypothetical protein [Streptomyces sp. NPDC058157]|uniref:hypothetical protein n=1 Tax=Streptomyces sp. NPDC058157 TaxID=3346360 RepID=UPI0036EA8B7E
MKPRRMIEILAQGAEQEIHDQSWVATPTDRLVAAQAAADLEAVLRTPHAQQAQQALPAIERLERLRKPSPSWP